MNQVYDILYMMGQDDITVGMGGEGLGEKMEENVCFMLLDVFVACKTRLGETLLAWAS